jgi:outer membrane protein OmpA-like peptidoglycan-associated protein
MKIISIVIALVILLPFSPLYAENCDKAQKYFRQAQNLGTDLPDLVQKVQLYEKVIELCPSHTEAYYYLGDTYEKQGRSEEAIAQYKRTIELDSSFARAYAGIGDIYFETGRAKEAIHWYEENLKYDPQDTVTKQRLTLARENRIIGAVKQETIRKVRSVTRGKGEVIKIIFGSSMIPFDFNKAEIRPDAVSQLNEIGKAFSGESGENKDIAVAGLDDESVIEIAGHTDVRGTDEYNLDLAWRRAESVVDYLVNYCKIPKEKLIAKGYGERAPLCTTGDDEACHALNRRVEILINPGEPLSRGLMNSPASFPARENLKIRMELGFFSLKEKKRQVEVLKEGSRLKSHADKYFFFFRPLQDCYVYILQTDSGGNIDLLFPANGGTGAVKEGKDYWVPSVFGEAFTLNKIKGEEKIYLLTTSWPLESAIEGVSLKEQVRGAIKGLQARAIKVVKPTGAPEAISSEELNKQPQKIDTLIERVEGEGGWVKVVRFWHE